MIENDQTWCTMSKLKMMKTDPQMGKMMAMINRKMMKSMKIMKCKS